MCVWGGGGEGLGGGKETRSEEVCVCYADKAQPALISTTILYRTSVHASLSLQLF